MEKVIAQQVYCGQQQPDGVANVEPGDQGPLPGWVYASMHEYTAGMVINLYKEAYGDAPIENPELVACFEDHFVLINEPTVPESVKSKRSPAQRLAQEMVEACQEYGVTCTVLGATAPAVMATVWCSRTMRPQVRCSVLPIHTARPTALVF